MTNDPINASTQPGEPGSPFTHRRGPAAWGRRILLGAALAGTFAAGALISTVAPAAAEAVAVAQAGMGMGMHGGSPAAMHAMMEAHLDRMLASVGASADQSSRIHAIFASAMGSLGPMHAQMAAAHAQFRTLLTAPTIDRAAIEKLRAEHMATADQLSRVMVGAMEDAAQVLTPEQRTKLATQMSQHHHMGMMPGGL